MQSDAYDLVDIRGRHNLSVWEFIVRLLRNEHRCIVEVSKRKRGQ